MNGFVDDSLKGLWNEFALLGHESRAYPSFVPPPSNLCERKRTQQGLERLLPCRGPRFSYQLPYRNLQPPVTPVLEYLTPSSDLWRVLCAQGAHTYARAHIRIK